MPQRPESLKVHPENKIFSLSSATSQVNHELLNLAHRQLAPRSIIQFGNPTRTNYIKRRRRSFLGIRLRRKKKKKNQQEIGN